MIENYEKKNAELSKDLPVLQEVKNTVWRKENELNAMKTEVAALERKIELSLKPMDGGEDKAENKDVSLPYGVSDKLQEYKESMGERLVIATVPKYDNDRQAKGIKI